MFGAIRRFGVSQVLRASVPRPLSVRWASQSLQWQSQSIWSPALARSFSASFPALKAEAAAAAAEADTSARAAEQSESELITEFADLKTKGLVDPYIVRNITQPGRMGLKTMTDVQSQTIHQMLRGDDVLAQAKTGTGKTLAFLVPSMHNILSDPVVQKNIRNARSEMNRNPQRRRTFDRYDKQAARAFAPDIRALIISPTRELAEQIAAEAIKVAATTGLKVQTAVGGSHKASGLQRIKREGCHLLIGTPGRVKDILSDRASGVSVPKLDTLILDEADRLLDDGFAPDIRAIQDLLPDPLKVDRQTIMFSATVPKEVMQMVRRTMKPNFKFIKTVRDDEVPTHLTVPQRTVFMRGYENALPAVLELAKNYQTKQEADPNLRPFKAIVYFNSTSEVNLAADTFSNLKSEPSDGRSRSPLGRMQILQIHSRLNQGQRTFSANTFRKASESILFSSDVTARGMDFPDVTHVIQVGIPRTRETYIHRIGRTARANKTGEGWLFLHDGENDYFEHKLRDLPLSEDSTSLPTAMANMAQASETASPATALTINQVKAAMEDVSLAVRETAYRSQLGTLTTTFRTKRQAVRALNDLAINGYGLSEIPSISARIASNLGLDRIPELKLDSTSRRVPRHIPGNHSEQSTHGFGSGRPRRSSGTDRDDRGFGRRQSNRNSSYGGRSRY